MIDKLEQKLSIKNIGRCIWGFDENRLAKHLFEVQEKDLCYNSIAPENCEYSV